MAGKGVPTVDQLETDVIMRIGQQYWIGRDESSIDFKQQVVDAIYSQEIRHSQFAQRRIMMLEFFRYLEQYLWPFYTPATSTDSFVLSIACMVNEKRRERVPVWPAFVERPDHFGHLIRQTLRLALDFDNQLSVKEHIVLVDFISHCLTSLEVDLVRNHLKRVISLGIWRCLTPRRLELTLKSQPRFAKLYKALLKQLDKASTSERESMEFEYQFLAEFIERFIRILYSVQPHVAETDELNKVSVQDRLAISYCERCLQLLIDLESNLLTRRFFNLLLDDFNVIVRCKLSPLAGASETDGKLFCQLLSMLEFYARFEIDELEGQALTSVQVDNRHCKDIVDLQKSLFRIHRDNLADLPRRFVVANVASLENEAELCRFLDKFDSDDLLAVSEHLGLRVEHPESAVTEQRSLITALMVYRFCKRKSQLDAINSMPLYPTEEIIWDENVVPVERYYGDGCLALPKLNLQFLTLHDYLMRNFHLFRLESTYEIRQDIEDAVARMRPCQGDMGEDEVVFAGWSRMALPIQSFSIIEVAKPLLGSNQPSKVRADVSVMLANRQDVANEWDSLRRHDPCFLITVRPTCPRGTKFDYKEPFVPQVGLACVRGCELEGLLDDEGKLIPEEQMHQMRPQGRRRTYRVRLDPCQYQADMERVSNGFGEDVYASFNILLRRKPKENNFKAVLETIRNLMNTKCVVPDWLLDLLLGYEDPSSASYWSRPDAYLTEQDWRDTFLGPDHLADCFPQFELAWPTDSSSKQPPYRLIFPTLEAEFQSEPDCKPILKAVPYTPARRGPYKSAQYKRNAVRFTPTQVRAIRSGMQPGLTLVVGPPGSGKTDVAVQIIANIYHNYPNQRTLLVTHSNQALNQLFEKIMALDIDQRHLLRLGHGEEALATEGDFSRHGRVNYILARRMQLLQEVGRLAESLGMPPEQAADSCEQAEYFFMYHVLDRWEAFLHRISTETADSNDKDSADASSNKDSAMAGLVSQHFPFHSFFANADYLPLFKGESLDADMDSARACFRHLESLFQQLSEFRSFEHMRSGVERANYLLVQEAKIIALTCTHASLRRQDLVQLAFHYDNIVMEESAQILEIETFIPLLLQNPDYQGNSTLKRWIMIGDHHQLPPVVKNMAFQKYSNMEQSLFTRLIKLGVPAVQLDAQGRARSSIAELYRWRYTRLADLPHVLLQPEFRFCNPGFEFDYQLVDVPDFNGTGESEPNPHFFQNLGEAEYAVAIFMYMRLIGWPADKITILTTYNGQKHLLRDIVDAKCADNPLLGRPAKVTTVDRYQGQQNDFVILSLVRTKAVGHVRDIRRLVVALSRARLGLLVLASESLFSNCFELRPAFDLLTKRPTQLRLLPWESYSVPRPINTKPARPSVPIADVFHATRVVQELHQARLRTMALAEPPRAPKPPSPPPLMPFRLPADAVQAYNTGAEAASPAAVAAPAAAAAVEVLDADDVELIEEVGVDTQTGTDDALHHQAGADSDQSEVDDAETQEDVDTARVEGYAEKDLPAAERESADQPANKDKSEETAAAMETPAAEGESKETPAAEGESKETPAAEGESKETPAVDGESKETPAAEGESKETPAAEGKSKETPAVDGESKETPAADGESRENLAAEGESNEFPAAEGESKEAPAAEGESKETPAAEGESRETPAAEGESRETPAAEGESKETPDAEGESKEFPAAEGESKEAPAAEGESNETTAAEGESQSSAAPEADSSAMSVDADEAAAAAAGADSPEESEAAAAQPPAKKRRRRRRRY